MTLTAASLFAGIGGFDLACERLGIEVAVQAEIDPSARAVLRQRFRAQLVDDARSAELRGVDLVTAGFPCQGLSAAASTRAHKGVLDPLSTSSVILPVLERIVAAKPAYVVLENADSLGTAQYASDLQTLVEILRGAGYFVAAVQINAGCYGTPMRRLRTFVLASRRPRTMKLENLVEWIDYDPVLGVNNQQGGATWGVQPSVTRKSGSYTLLVTRDEVLSVAPEGVERLFGFPVGWTTPAGSATSRYERLGNAVAVGAATAALSLLLTGQAPVLSPAWRLSDLREHATPAPGAAASALGRILRTTGGRRGRPNANQIELDYALPVYLRVAAAAKSLRPAMRSYLEPARALLTPPQPWPDRAEIRMVQGRGLFSA